MRDLLVYDRALGTGQGLLGAAGQTERLTSFPGAAGYGIGVGCIDGWVGHTGELPGDNTALYYDTASDTSIVVQTNSDIAAGDCPESPRSPMIPAKRCARRPLSTATGHTFTPIPQK